MTETPPAAQTEARASAGSRRWLLGLLVASLAFNLFVIGAAVAERLWPERAESMRTPRVTELLPRNFFVGLDRERRDELKVVFQERRQTFRDERRALREAAQHVADALGQEPYDSELVRRAITEYGDANRKLVDLGLAVTQDLVERLTPEERRELADHIRKRAAPPRSRRKTN